MPLRLERLRRHATGRGLVNPSLIRNFGPDGGRCITGDVKRGDPGPRDLCFLKRPEADATGSRRPSTCGRDWCGACGHHPGADARRPGLPGGPDGGGRPRFQRRIAGVLRGRNLGLPNHPTDESRLRYFGGTSGHWEGKCRALEPYDFEVRPWIPLSGWPIARTDLDPYLPGAAEVLDIAQPAELPDLPLKQAGGPVPPLRLALEPAGPLWRQIPATATAAPGSRPAEREPGRPAASGRSRQHHRRGVQVLRPRRPGLYRAGPRLCALPGGHGERARPPQRPQPGPDGHRQRQRPAVGRYFCDRPTVFIGDFLSAEPVAVEPKYYAPTPRFMEAEQITNFSISVEPWDDRRAHVGGGRGGHDRAVHLAQGALSGPAAARQDGALRRRGLGRVRGAARSGRQSPRLCRDRDGADAQSR